MSSEMVTTAEAARLLNLTRTSATSAIVRGRMYAEKRGRRWYVARAEVERYRVFHLDEQDTVTPPRHPHPVAK